MPQPRLRPCLGVGTATRCNALTRNTTSRCDDCQRQWRGIYGSEHRRLRAHWAPIVATGTVRCARAGCGELIHPDEPWDLGHRGERYGRGTDTVEYSGPEHQACNRGHRPREGSSYPTGSPVVEDSQTAAYESPDCPF